MICTKQQLLNLGGWGGGWKEPPQHDNHAQIWLQKLTHGN